MFGGVGPTELVILVPGLYIMIGILLDIIRKGRGIYAKFWRRTTAYLIDSFIIIIPLLGIRFLLREAWLLIILLELLAPWLYFAGMESSSSQAAFGKKAMSIIVTDLNGNRISFGKATGRVFAKLISALILFFGFFMAGFTEKRQALHDILANTLVVQKAKADLVP